MATYYPTYNSPKEINIEDFIPPSTIIETVDSGLKIQENVIFTSHPIYVNYQMYNWMWSINDGAEVTNSNKWLWVDSNDFPIPGTAGMSFSEAEAVSTAESLGSPLEIYAPVRIWVGSSITGKIANTPGQDNRAQRDHEEHKEARASDIGFYQKKGRPLLGKITSERSPNHIEYYIKNGVIITNFDFDNDPDAKNSLVIAYQTITDNLKVKITLRTNEPQKSYFTPVIDNYILRVTGQTSTKEKVS